MEEKSFSKTLIIGGIIVSILHSIFFWRQAEGISAPIFAIIFLIYLICCIKQKKIKANHGAYILAVPILLLSATYFIYNNATFRFLNFWAIIGLVVIMTILLITKKTNHLFVKILRSIFKPIEYIGEVFKNIGNIIHKKEEKKPKTQKAKIIKAIFISLPIAIIVIFLLMAADETFAEFFQQIMQKIIDLFNIQSISELVVRAFLAFIIFLYFTSFILNMLSNKTAEIIEKENQKPSSIHIEETTIQVLLTILNGIYLLFSLVQLVNIFTEMGVPRELGNYAIIARQGFFQLMLVTLINLAAIYFSCKNTKSTNSTYTKAMSQIMLLFNIFFIFIAAYKMFLYEQEFGYTYSRLLVYFILATELLFIIPCSFYIYNKKVPIFKIGLGIVTTMYVILNFANIDAIIAKRNIDRYIETGKIDFAYLEDYVGTDAKEQMERLLTEKPKTQEYEEIDRKLERYFRRIDTKLKKERQSIFSFNLSKNRFHIDIDSLKEYNNDDLLI